MKQFLLAVLTTGLLFACKDNKTDKEKINREKDDYSKSGKTENAATKTTDETGSQSAKTGTDASSSGSSSTASWPQSEKDGFMRSCERSALKSTTDKGLAERYCQCMMEKMEKAYPDIYEASKLPREEIEKFTNANREDCLDN